MKIKDSPQRRDIMTNVLGLAIASIAVAGQQGLIEPKLSTLIGAILSAGVAYFVK